MNNFCMTGNIAQDLNLKTTESGKHYTSFRMAVKRPHVKDKTDFFTFKAFNQTADTLCQYCKKGSRIAATGYIQVNEWQTQEGQKRYDVEFIIDTFDFLYSRSDDREEAEKGIPVLETMKAAPSSPSQVAENEKAEGNTLPEINYSELPFEL